MRFLLSALMVSWWASAAQAGPSINIGTIYDYLDGDKSSFLKRVYNGGDSTAFVRVNIYEMTFDANGKATETPLTVDGPVSVRKGLVASPARLIVPASGTQASRLLYIGERNRERYYRVRFVPVVPEKEDQFEVSEAEREQYKQAMSAGVNVLTGYGAIFFVRPENTRFDTKIQNAPGEYRVENAGNSTIELDEFKNCAVAKKSDCQATRKHHVRPGNSFSFTKEAGRVYRFDLVEGSSTKKVEVKG